MRPGETIRYDTPESKILVILTDHWVNDRAIPAGFTLDMLRDIMLRTDKDGVPLYVEIESNVIGHYQVAKREFRGLILTHEGWAIGLAAEIRSPVVQEGHTIQRIHIVLMTVHRDPGFEPQSPSEYVMRRNPGVALATVKFDRTIRDEILRAMVLSLIAEEFADLAAEQGVYSLRSPMAWAQVRIEPTGEVLVMDAGWVAVPYIFTR